MADASKVVTLGADLTDEQKNTMMNYFKADASQVQVISVTNQDEHDLLGKYIPSEQIGTITLLFFISSSSIVHADRKSEYLPTGNYIFFLISSIITYILP